MPLNSYESCVIHMRFENMIAAVWAVGMAGVLAVLVFGFWDIVSLLNQHGKV